MNLLFNIGFLEVGLVDVIDIIFVTFLIVQVYNLMSGSVAIKIFFGFIILYLIYQVVNAFQMELLSNILGQFMGVGVIAAIILFQQEIRKFLLLLGKGAAFDETSLFKNWRFLRSKEDNSNINIMPVLEAAKSLSATKTGALIVFSRNSVLKFYAESGDILDATISKRLILSIFNKNSPLHDGAVIIHQNKIIAARCILPVTEKSDLPAQYGLRHRAAVGMSENTDTLIVTVSEETGQISAVRNGSIFSSLGIPELRKRLNDYLLERETALKDEDPLISPDTILPKVKSPA